MGENSKISWTNNTFNPWIGCTKVSPGCDNCYAETLMDKRFGKVKWGPHGERVKTSPSNWYQPIKWNKAAALSGSRPRVFCASLSDWLDNQVPELWRLELACLIEATPNLDWLLLTKCIENYGRLSPWKEAPPRNVWLGVTAEDQEHYVKRWGILKDIGPALRFISYEPAIGPITHLDVDGQIPDWIIMGGESGEGARPMQPEWARSMRDLCHSNCVPFFFKQWGEFTPENKRVGKENSGHFLDGVEYHQFPKVQS